MLIYVQLCPSPLSNSLIHNHIRNFTVNNSELNGVYTKEKRPNNNKRSNYNKQQIGFTHLFSNRTKINGIYICLQPRYSRGNDQKGWDFWNTHTLVINDSLSLLGLTGKMAALFLKNVHL